MSEIYIANIYYKELANKVTVTPRERFIRYYDDLYNQESTHPVDRATYFQGSQYTYAELGDAVLQECHRDGIFANLELMIVCYWSHEFDPDYSCGGYFCDKYNIKCRVYDVCDQGILSPITAMKILQSYFKYLNINNALLLCFDQTCIPHEKEFKGRFPTHTSSLAIYCENKSSSDSKYKLASVSLTNNEKNIVEDGPGANCADIFRELASACASNNYTKDVVVNIYDSKLNTHGSVHFINTFKERQ